MMTAPAPTTTAAPSTVYPLSVTVLAIAGSDSSGGAGVQADTKTLTALRVYAATAITALTAQDTCGVAAVHPVPADFVRKQISVSATDIPPQAIKTGMLASEDIVLAVAEEIASTLSDVPVVVDPVMVSTSGATLLDPGAVHALKTKLLPLAHVCTPNIPEAAALLGGMPMASMDDVREAARAIALMGPRWVLLKGGHRPFQSDEEDGRMIVVDLLWSREDEMFFEFKSEWSATKNTHGTGCTLSSAIAAGLAKGRDVPDAVRDAIAFVQTAMRTPGFSLGHGNGPLDHCHAIAEYVPNPSFQVSTVKQTERPRDVTTTPFLSMLIESCRDEWDGFLHHAFVKGLEAGKLPTSAFRHYIRQDYLFLRHYARAFALAGYKEHDMDGVLKAGQMIQRLCREAQLHVKFCERWGISKSELEATQEATATIAYTRYVLEKGLSGDRLDLFVALAPRFVGYAEIGRNLGVSVMVKDDHGHPYRDWVLTYAGAEFQDTVRALVDNMERVAEEDGIVARDASMAVVGPSVRLERLKETFRQATLCETKFWDMGLNELD